MPVWTWELSGPDEGLSIWLESVIFSAGRESAEEFWFLADRFPEVSFVGLLLSLPEVSVLIIPELFRVSLGELGAGEMTGESGEIRYSSGGVGLYSSLSNNIIALLFI